MYITDTLEKMSERSIVAITGRGAVTALGHNLDATCDALWRGERAIRNERDWLEQIVPPAYVPRLRSHLAARILGFDFHANPAIANQISERDVRRYYSTAAQYFIWASVEALSQAHAVNEKLEITAAQSERSAIVVGTGIGGAGEIPEYAHTMTRGKRLAATDMSKGQPDNPMIMASLLFKTRAGNATEVRACAAGNAAIAHGARLIQHGEADLVVAGGTEGLSGAIIAMFEVTGAASESEDPNSAPWPFRKENPGGAVLGEGAGVVVLENYNNAIARGANVLALVTGFGETSDAYDYTMLDGLGAARAMRLALGRAGVSREVAILLNAHGTGAGKGDGDQTETRAFLDVFSNQDSDYLPEQIEGQVFSLRGALGHPMGGAKGIDMAVSLRAMEVGKIPPSGLDSVLEGMERFVPATKEPVPTKARVLLSNGMGFGGSNVSIVAELP